MPGNSAENPHHVQVSALPPVTVKPASDPDLAKFWGSLRGVKPENGFLNFHVRSSLLPKTMKKLYIRKAYEDLFTIICKNLEEKEIEKRLTGIAITGTPGIGKSMFLFYILWRLANMETTKAVIIHRQVERGGIYVFQNSGCWETFNYPDVAGLLKDDSTYTWYLTDALEPPPARVRAVTILVSSPARKYYSKFLPLSHVAPLHYLPTWSLEELKRAAHVYFKSPEVVEERFNMIGGIARYVLEKDEDLETKSEITHRLVHFKVEPPCYTKYTHEF